MTTQSRSKYFDRGPYHFVEFCDENSPYHAHVMDLVERVSQLSPRIPRTEASLRVWDVGCGEGLILSQLWQRLPMFSHCTGFDADAEAIRMARLLVPHLHFEHEHDVPEFCDPYQPDLVLFCDSLEHIAEWVKHVRWAATKAGCVVIAAPSKHDPNGLTDFAVDAFDQFFDDWKLAHRKTRDHRHLSIWMRS